MPAKKYFSEEERTAARRAKQQRADAKRADSQKQKSAEWRRDNPQGHWAPNLAKYGLTLDDYFSLVERQDNRCAICFADKPGGRGRWHVDHDHSIGLGNKEAVRGLLCTNCNSGLGKLGDSPDRLREAAEYLEVFNIRGQQRHYCSIQH